MENLFLILAVSLLPGLAWLYYFYRKDKYEPEPKRLVLLAFLYGILVIIPVGIIEAPFSGLMSNPPDLVSLLLVSILVIGLVEEVAKYAVIRYTIYHSSEFNEVMDGIIYCVSAGLGFATAENFLYTFIFGYQVGIARALVTSLLHASFSGIMGYYLGRAKCEEDSSLIKKGLGQVILFHGIYDFLILGRLISIYFVYGLVALFYLYLGKLIKNALKLSPFQQD